MTLSELYQEAARVAKMIEGTNLTIGYVVKICGHVYGRDYLSFDTGNAKDYEFALAIVEGKPVFKGDVLYHYLVPEGCRIVSLNEKGLIAFSFENKINDFVFYKNLSWNKPKPKTVMVELLREDVEYWGSYGTLGYEKNYMKYPVYSKNFFEACKKALEE